MSFIRSGLALALALTLASTAQAADKVKAGTAVAGVFTFTPLDIGMAKGIFPKHGIEVEISAMRGDAQLQQGMTAGSLDVALGSGPGLAFMAKGVPAKGVAAFALDPRNLSLVVPLNSPIKGKADLKGKKLAVTTGGSLTDWLVRETSRQQGWGAEGITPVPLGAPTSSIAAMKTGQVDGILIATELGYAMEAKGEGKMLFTYGDITPDFHTHILFARDELIAKNPDLVRRFVKAFFETIGFMYANKAETVKLAAKAMNLDEAIVSRTYDEEISMLSKDGVFRPKAMDTLVRSWVELGILPEKPDVSKLINTSFVPPK
jgi:ABC-type nitrate/sulfonate/bicarbonate transport system substrate-binding protein